MDISKEWNMVGRQVVEREEDDRSTHSSFTVDEHDSNDDVLLIERDVVRAESQQAEPQANPGNKPKGYAVRYRLLAWFCLAVAVFAVCVSYNLKGRLEIAELNLQEASKKIIGLMWDVHDLTKELEKKNDLLSELRNPWGFSSSSFKNSDNGGWLNAVSQYGCKMLKPAFRFCKNQA